MRYLLFLFLMSFGEIITAQSPGKDVVDAIFNEALNDRTSYQQLHRLCKEAPGRLSGTDEIDTALDLTAEFLNQAGADTVFYQPLMAPNWKRGKPEICYISLPNGSRLDLSVCVLGFSIGTGRNGVESQIVEVSSFKMLEKMPEENVRGKMVFFNQPFENELYNTFEGYSKSGKYRVYGAVEAAKKGAIGAIIRSATNVLDDYPHTGVMRYAEGIPKIPAVCISTLDANVLSEKLTINPNAKVFLQTTCENMPEKESYNVIGEIQGSSYPEKFIVIGGHIDTWFNGEGAHDNGAGCIQSIEVLRLFNALNIKPKHTIRAVMFMDEEMSQSGGKAYAARADRLNEFHLVAIESDRGAFTPLGFTMDADSSVIQSIQEMKKPFEAYGISVFKRGYGGVDIYPLKELGVPLIGFLPDWHRYFKYHHAATDTFEEVHQRELQLGSAAIASLVYMIDQNGL